MVEYNETLGKYSYVDQFRTVIDTPTTSYNGSYVVDMETLDGSTGFYNPFTQYGSYTSTMSWVEQGD